MSDRQIQDLLTRNDDTESWVVIEDGQVVAIGTLKVDDEQRTGMVQNFAYYPRHEPAALEMLEHLTFRTRAKKWIRSCFGLGKV